MNKKAFIESGILEAFVLGMANEEEKRAVIRFAETNEASSDYLLDLELHIRGFLDDNKVTPPLEARDVLALRSKEFRQQKTKTTFTNNASNNKKYLDVEVSDSYIKVHKNWRPAFIAVFILSKIFLILGLYYYFKSASLETELAKLKAIPTEIIH